MNLPFLLFFFRAKLIHSPARVIHMYCTSFGNSWNRVASKSKLEGMWHVRLCRSAKMSIPKCLKSRNHSFSYFMCIIHGHRQPSLINRISVFAILLISSISPELLRHVSCTQFLQISWKTKQVWFGDKMLWSNLESFGLSLLKAFKRTSKLSLMEPGNQAWC